MSTSENEPDATSESAESATVPETPPPIEGASAEENELVTIPERPARGNTAKRDAQIIRALERDTKAVQLRVQGLTFDTIARRLGYGHRGHAQRAVKKRITTMRQECAQAVEDLRFVECQRLDVALRAIMPLVRQRDMGAIDRMLRIQERRAAYEGLDQPKGLKVEVAREIENIIDRVREEFDDDVYERFLAIFAGELGSLPSSPDPASPGGEEGEGSGGSAEEPPAPDA